MTPQEQAFNTQIKNDPAFTEVEDEVSELRKGQQEIKATLKKEVESQQEFEGYVRDEFEKGTAKFSKVESRMNEIEDNMQKGLKTVIDTINNKELASLREEIRNTKQAEKDKVKDSRALKYSLIVALFSAVLAGAVTYFVTK